VNEVNYRGAGVTTETREASLPSAPATDDALRRSEDRADLYRAILNRVPDAVLHIDPEGVIRTANQAAGELFGVSQQALIGRPVETLMPDAHAARHADYIARYERTGNARLRPFLRRLEARHASGHLVPVEIAVADINAGGERGYVGVVRDVTAKVEEETRLDTVRQAAEDAARLGALAEMAASIAHELNQPLTALGNYIDLAIAKLRAGAPRDDVLDALSRARDMTAIGGDMVLKVRRLTQRGQLERRRASLNAVLSESLTFFDGALKRSRIEVRRDFAPEDPCADIDVVQIQQVAINLIRNAMQAVETSERRAITLSTRRLDEAVEFCVADSGPGVPEAVRERIFESFTTDKPGGAGLGLAIARRIVDAHGGAIWAEAAPGGGARLCVRLPLKETQA